MSAIDELRSYAKRLQDRFRLGVLVRGAAVLAGLALVATVVLVLISSHFAFSDASLWSARFVLLLALGLGAAFGLAIPLWRWSQRLWVRRAEIHFPQFGQRLLTFSEREAKADPFLELLAADTLDVARSADVKSAVPDRLLVTLLALGIASLGALVWLIHAGPGYLGYGAKVLWTGPAPQPFYQIQVVPGDATLRRHADALITARLAGLDGRPLAINVRGKDGKWAAVAMQQRPAGPGYQFLFAGLPEDVEYYVSQGSIHTKHFHLKVADIPVVRQIRVTYHAPEWMRQPPVVEEHGGDIKAVAGTLVLLEIHTDLPMFKGVLVLDDGKELPLAEGEGNIARTTLTLDKAGTYHVAARDTGVGTQRLTEDYYIDVGEVKPPEVALVRPGQDYRASPIEEVTLAAEASDPYGLTELSLRYSVNGGPEQSVRLLKDAGSQKADGRTLLQLEDLKLVPGDVVSLYAQAKDARSESRTDIAFIQIEPYEREFSQSQQSGGGGGGGGGGNDQAQIAEREKEIIAATWRQAGLTSRPAGQAAEQAKFLSDVQTTLRGQAESLSGRLQMRDLQLQNDQFGSFEQDMAAAAAAMRPAAAKLASQAWRDAVPDEQKALQYLLRAEATFRQIQVAFGSAAGAGGGGSAGRDLASLFDLELDTQKNQYESAQTASTPEARAAQIDDALKKLDELARRQNALADRSKDGQQSAEQRWQQEMLRRKIQELTQQLQQLAQNGQQGGQQGSQGQAGGQSGGQAGEPSSQSTPQNSAQSRQAREALGRLRQAQENMRRAAESRDPAAAREAAQQVREAMNLLGGMQTQDAGRQVDALSQEAGRIAGQQRQQAGRMHSVQGPSWPGSRLGRATLESLINDRQKLADDLAKLQGDMRSAARATLEHNKDASQKLREALNDLEQADTETQMQRSADRMRRGWAPLSDAPEEEIAQSLQHLQEQLGAARTAMAAGGNGKPGDEALDATERLRGRLAALDESLRRRAAQAQSGGQAGQSGGQSGGQAGGQGRAGQTGDTRTGEARAGGGGVTGPVDGAWNSGNDAPLRGGGAVAPQQLRPSGDPEQFFRQALREGEQLRRAVQDDPEARRQAEELIRAMQNLDPKRFPGNPALVDELYTRMVAGVDRLELTLRHESADNQPGQVHSDNAAPVPDGYQQAVADYFRRLSKNH